MTQGYSLQDPSLPHQLWTAFSALPPCSAPPHPPALPSPPPPLELQAMFHVLEEFHAVLPAYLEALKPAADGEEGGEAGTGKPGSGRVTSAAPTKGGKAPDRKAGGKEAVVVVDPESLLPVRGWCEAPKTMQQVWGWCEAAGVGVV